MYSPQILTRIPLLKLEVVRTACQAARNAPFSFASPWQQMLVKAARSRVGTSLKILMALALSQGASIKGAGSYSF